MISPLGHPHTVEQSLNLGIKLLEAGRDIGEMVTHTFPIEEAELAVRTAGYETSEAPIKVAIRPNG
jgi:threonine dehydrogenase-like Zn-dependent dehydrogenase